MADMSRQYPTLCHAHMSSLINASPSLSLLSCIHLTYMHWNSTFRLAVLLVLKRRLRPRASKRFLSSASGGRTLWGYAPIFRPPLSTLSAPEHIPTPLRASLNGTRKVARVQEALHGMTVVPP